MEKVSTELKDDIESTKKLLYAVHDLSVFIATAVKTGWKKSYVFDIIGMASQIASVAEEVKQILPELKDLDKKEAQEITGILYDTVKTIVDMFEVKTEEEFKTEEEAKREDKKSEREDKIEEKKKEIEERRKQTQV